MPQLKRSLCPACSASICHAIRVPMSGAVFFARSDRSARWKGTLSAHTGKNVSYIKILIMTPKNTICLWFDKDAHEAARFYAATFPDSTVSAVHKAPSDYPSGKKGDVLTVNFTVLGIPCIGLN